jgi:purine-binding chemotaxis protein CheW
MAEINKIKDANQELQLVSFHVGNEEFGIDILRVKEIIRILEITKVPNSPDYVEGVINLRGRVIPIIDLRVRLKVTKTVLNTNSRIIVLEIEDKTVGFIVDSVSEVLRISTSLIEAPPSIVSNINSEYITAIVKLDDKLLILLDMEKVLSAEEKKELIAEPK